MERAVIKSAGSSPHTRGARHPFRNARRQLRIIPAYAGSTTTLRRPSRISWDHPRIRGEHDCSIYFTNFPPGSSPHTRGARLRYLVGRLGRRIIPAYAGSTPAPPRNHLMLSGSSPHTRGARSTGSSRRCRRRIIPAYAGSTVPVSVTPVSRWDHPRIRGEHGGVDYRSAEAWGSSPHTRGAQPAGAVAVAELGIIPAYAGSTFLPHPRRPRCEDHPRIRGEHWLAPPERPIR